MLTKHTHKRLWGKAAAMAITIVAVFGLTSTVLADAISLTLASADGIWIDARTSGGSDPTCVRYNNTATVGDENQVAYGRSGSSCPSSLDLTQQSGFGFDGSAPPSMSFDSGEVFLIGELIHYNRPIQAPDKLQHVDLRLDLEFSDPAITTSLTYTLTLDETPNQAPCAYSGTSVCPDRVTFEDTIPDETFGPIEGKYYTLQIVGFAPGEPGTCEYVPGATINEFITEESEENHACLFGQVLVAEPSIDIEKNPASQVIDYDGTATFDITVTNEGNATLSNIVVTDALAPDCDRSLGSLNAGESTTYTCTKDNVAADFTNSIEVSGDYLSSSYTDTDTADVDVRPAISVVKSASPTSVVEPSGSVTFDVSVANDSAESVTLTSLIDDVHGDLNGLGDCSVPQTLTAGSSYSCSFTATVSGNAGDSETDTITATVADDEDNSVQESDDATVTVDDREPTDLDIVVSKNASPTSVVEPSGLVTFDVTVTNTGPEDLTLTSLIDDVHGDLNGLGDCSVPQTLTAGSSYSCSFTATVSGNAGDSETDTITATVADDEDNEASDSDSATVDITGYTPSEGDITVVKNATPDSVVEPSGPVTFDVTVTNTGPEDLTLTSLIDDVHGDLNGQGDCSVPQTLAAGGGSFSCSFTATISGNAGDSETDTITATVADDEDNEASDSDSATVDITGYTPNEGDITVVKNATPDSVVEPSGLVTFDVTVTNTGPEDLTLTSLIDDVHGNLNGQGNCSVPQTLTAGSSYSCSFTATVSGNAGDSETDTIIATVADDEGNEAFDSDSATVTVTDATPSVSIAKTASDSSVPEPGSAVDFTLTITKDSAEPVTITDLDDTYSLSAECNALVGTDLSAGASASCQYTVDFTGYDPGTYSNTADVTVTDDEGNEASDSASETVYIASIHVEKSASPEVIESGDLVEYTYVVTNPGDQTLSDVTVSDDKCAPVTYVSGDGNGDGQLDPDETWVYTCSQTIAVDTINTATASGTDPAGTAVQDTDTASVDVMTPEEDGDQDGDGTPDFLDDDVDGDGIPNSVEGDGDSDGDGIPDYQDTDSDNDGIPDSVEGEVDTDGDGVPDYLDEDSDDDGIPDAVEGTVDTDGDGIPDYRDTDSDGDGILDDDEDECSPGVGSGEPCDSDGDGIPDYRDLDSDNDGILDDDEDECSPGVGSGEPCDTDGDGIPDYRDLDSDNDGILDDDEDECSPGIGSGEPCDTDGDGIPDYRDTDSDNDGILDDDEDECSPGVGSGDPCDTDSDGIPDYRDLDSDGDGLSDDQEWSNGPDDPLVGCSSGDPTCTDNDVDGDGTPNYRDLDSDGDGLLDEDESPVEDEDGDGIPDWIDPDRFYYLYFPVLLRP
jgi:uncharacterized repeat protein (TIGR01451 family)